MDKSRNLTRTSFVIAFVFIAIGGLVFGPLGLSSQQAQAQAQAQSTEQMIRETQQSAQQYLTENEKRVGNTEYEIRWGAVQTVQPDTLAALFADCAPGEYAVSEQHMFETREVTDPLSFTIANPDNTMSWLMVVYNSDDDALQASVAAVCVDEAGSSSASDDSNIDYNTKDTIQNIVNEIIVRAGTINFGQIVNIYQNITQVANQIVNITGNNNTVTQIINQSASQILASNATSAEQISQIINQTASQQGVIVGDNNNLNQTTTQNAQQQARVNATTGGPGTIPADAANAGPGGTDVNATGGAVSAEQTQQQQGPPPSETTTIIEDPDEVEIDTETPPTTTEQDTTTTTPEFDSPLTEEEEAVTPEEQDAETTTDEDADGDGGGGDGDGGDADGSDEDEEDNTGTDG
jgi:uncharacterized protein YheU (UPF0270 family)